MEAEAPVASLSPPLEHGRGLPSAKALESQHIRFLVVIGVKPTSPGQTKTDANDPTSTSAGNLVDKILRAAKPAKIPVEQPAKFDLIINLTTAKALGLTVPFPGPAELGAVNPDAVGRAST